ncbi:TSPAN13 family protein [Megaselia abdita]
MEKPHQTSPSFSSQSSIKEECLKNLDSRLEVLEIKNHFKRGSESAIKILKMCGGFYCTRNALISLNTIYIMIGIVLIACGVYATTNSIVTNLPIVGGIIACGFTLIIVAFLGLLGAVKHHQVMLFFYMALLFILFLIQFAIATSCLAVNSEEQQRLAEHGWRSVTPEVRQRVQNEFLCCGFNGTFIAGEDTTNNPLFDDQVTCAEVNKKCCANSVELCSGCHPCMPILEDKIDYGFKLCGGLGIFFSFTEFLGVWLTVRYRNLKDPKGLPSAFL